MSALLAGHPMLVPGLFCLLLVAGCVALLLSGGGGESRRVNTRMRRAQGEDVAERAAVPRQQRMIGMIGALGGRFAESGLLSSGTVRELEQTLAAAGIAQGRALGIFIASKIIGAVAMPILTALLLPRLPLPGTVRIGVIFASAVLGLLLPDLIIRQRRSAYVRRLEAGLGDALDLMVICAEAGLAMEPALQRVAKELAQVHPALSVELMRTVQELQIMSDPRTALQNMGGRTGVAGLKRLGATMIQSMFHGTPLIQALRTLSIEMRGEILLRFEERAARLPTLLTIPMIIFILPCLFLVVGGPAVVQVMHEYRHH